MLQHHIVCFVLVRAVHTVVALGEAVAEAGSGYEFEIV